MDSLTGRRLITIGIFAHVDGGKTTLTEQMLFKSGAVRAPGRVDSGSAHTDFMEIERRRGISVRAASVNISWNGAKIYIIDTPGHSDFAADTKRAAAAVDAAVIVVSAVEGVQPQTELIWRFLEDGGVPALFFVNKTDRDGADIKSALASIKELTGKTPVKVDVGNKEAFAEAVVEYEDAALEKYLSDGADAFSCEELCSVLRAAFYSRKLLPYVSGSALLGDGVDGLLELVSSLAKYQPEEGALSGAVFKVEHSASLGRVAHLRLFSGSLRNRDAVRLSSGFEEKITQIREVQGGKERDVGMLRPGEVGAVYGLAHAVSGDFIGCSPAKRPAEAEAPALRVKAEPRRPGDYPALAAAFSELEAEDPSLCVIWERELRELLVRVTGAIQIEVLEETLKTRFGIDAVISEPQVVYKERPVKKAHGFVEYTMPKPCWAVMDFEIEPLPLGSGVMFESVVPNDRIYDRYQAQIRHTIPEALRQGPKGWEVTDLKITLVGGEHHTVHTHPLDFVLATPMGIMDGLVSCGTELLEPVLEFRLVFPEEAAGKIVGEILAMRGSFEAPAVKRGSFMMEGLLPLATSMDFPMRLASITGGRGVFSVMGTRYMQCPPGEGAETPYRGVSPLDRAKYILYKRGALGA